MVRRDWPMPAEDPQYIAIILPGVFALNAQPEKVTFPKGGFR